MAERWPVQAQRSKQKVAIAESEQPTSVALDAVSISTTLAGLVRDVMATEMPLNQPFMEVRDLPIIEARCRVKHHCHIWSLCQAILVVQVCCGLAQAGLDSLGALELRNAVSNAFGIPVPASLACDYPTQAALASYISSELAAKAVTPPLSQAITMPDQHQGSKTTDLVSVACQYPAAEATGKPSSMKLLPLNTISYLSGAMKRCSTEMPAAFC